MGETKRKMLTPAERVAKAEAELAAAKEKAEAGDRKRHDQLQEQRAKHVEVIDDRTAKVEAIDAELNEIIERVPALAESRPTLSVVEGETNERADRQAAAI